MATDTATLTFTLTFTPYFDGRDGAGEVGSDARNSDRNYLVQRTGDWTTYGRVMRDATTKRWSGYINGGDRVTHTPRMTRREASADLVALYPYGCPAYGH